MVTPIMRFILLTCKLQHDGKWKLLYKYIIVYLPTFCGFCTSSKKIDRHRFDDHVL